uniref:Zinc finger, CCHC domain containing 2 n=1 Tax=Sinocyclocheilus grahami TaxID=75366 RepID=A0A672SUX9_SINGR
MKLRAAGGENHRCDLNSVNGSDRESGTGAAQLDKEAVFEWFGLQLNPSGRVELLCGLLHMCQPLELRFLGACLEDLARRDFTVLRDYEIRANCPADLEGLVDVSDPVVLSKLLVYLSLLGSKSRECAGILFRTLSRMDAGMCGALPEPETVDQLRLLFTMGSLHPAFSFYQREELRAQLDRLQRWGMRRDSLPDVESNGRRDVRRSTGAGDCGSAAAALHDGIVTPGVQFLSAGRAASAVGQTPKMGVLYSTLSYLKITDIKLTKT